MTTIDQEELNLAKLAEAYADNESARALLEAIRWPNGPICPHCQAAKPYIITSKKISRRPARKGLYKCRNKECHKQFSVTVGTIFQDSKIPLGKWMMAFFIIGSSKKGISAHQLHRMLGVTYKTSWFMCHRIRHAMTIAPTEKLSGTVEMDAAFIGGKPTKELRARGKWSSKIPVVALVERNGDVRPKVVASVTHKNLRQFVTDNIAGGSIVNTDGAGMFNTLIALGSRGSKWVSVNHSAKEFKRTEPDGSKAHVNTCESFFSLFKRGMMGAFHHVSPEHLQRYGNEFAFRWNHRNVTDGERFWTAVKSSEGKRLKYQNTIAA